MAPGRPPPRCTAKPSNTPGCSPLPDDPWSAWFMCSLSSCGTILCWSVGSKICLLAPTGIYIFWLLELSTQPLWTTVFLFMRVVCMQQLANYHLTFMLIFVMMFLRLIPLSSPHSCPLKICSLTHSRILIHTLKASFNPRLGEEITLETCHQSWRSVSRQQMNHRVTRNRSGTGNQSLQSLLKMTG